ncbi:ElyC/SanA/YdcF family protein [Thermodesulfobacteriota bacterium]
MLFVLKKIATLAVYPLSLCLTALVGGLFFIWFTRRQKMGKTLVTIGVVALIFFSYGFMSNHLLSSLENEYPPLTDMKETYGVKWVVVLGGGMVSDPKLPANGQISASSLSRLVEGIRIHNNLEGSKLILSGGAVFDPIPEARVMSEVALTLGVDPEDMLLEWNSKDTDDQAQLIRQIANLDENQKFILVTSASHMPRAVNLFRSFGMQPIPAPIDFGVKNQIGVHPKFFFPTASGLAKMERVFHEYLGLAWAKLKTENK